MKQTYRITVDCANCANQIEHEAQKIDGILSLSISFLTGRMKVTFAEDAEVEAVLGELLRVARRIEPDFEIHGY